MRIAFFSMHPFHRAMLERPFRLGSTRDWLECLWIDDRQVLADADADIVVSADRVPDIVTGCLSPHTKYVFTRHGFSTKNWLGSCLKACDHACVSSDWVRDDLSERYGEPPEKFWITGFTATDVLWEMLQGAHPRSRTTTILYAPTWQPELSAHSVVGSDWARDWLQVPDRQIIAKFHPHAASKTPDAILEWYELKKQHPGQIAMPHPDTNIYEIMAAADILVTDTSSVMFYWLAVDRPLILVDPDPGTAKGQFFDPEGPEWHWRDMAHRVANAGELRETIEACVDGPDSRKEIREVYRTRVFGNRFDGKASERLVGKLVELAQAR